eukprot:TRINITY_DN1293_c0_g1_i2.p1 TRINITY_DN1293_c0_g1~~TRINITY_DN1293_c0_g1_i2.p1  ORF type:complete len:576 (-),score=70.47 TRINITY_DN1293_c0_g1_i2:248-1858(-)
MARVPSCAWVVGCQQLEPCLLMRSRSSSSISPSSKEKKRRTLTSRLFSLFHGADSHKYMTIASSGSRLSSAGSHVFVCRSVSDSGVEQELSADGKVESFSEDWDYPGEPSGMFAEGSLDVPISREVDIAIVGGGPGGMAAACAIRKTRPDVSVGVFERSGELRRIGWAIGVAVNGMHAIQAISQELCDEIAKHSMNKPMTSQDVQGNVIRDVPFFYPPTPGHEDVHPGLVPWYILQRSFAATLPTESLHLGHSFDTLEQDSDGVTLTFSRGGESGERERVGVRAKVVIGADGNQSAVRQIILNDGPPLFLNTAVWRGQCAIPQDWEFKEKGVLGVMDRQTSNLFMVVALPGDILAWQLMSPWPAERLKELSSARYVDADALGVGTRTKIDRCLSKMKELYPDWALRLVSGTDLNGVTEHGQFYREADTCRTWIKGRVALLGDAAHLNTPFLGQGTNQTLEDAVALGRSVGKYGATAEALKDYEAERASYAADIQAASVQIAKDIFFHQIPGGEMKWLMENPEKVVRRHEPLQLAVA